MGCSASSDSGPAHQGARETCDTTTHWRASSATYNTHTTDVEDNHPTDDKAVYGYDPYGDDNRTETAVDSGGGRWRPKRKEKTKSHQTLYDDAGYYGQTETEKGQQELFDGTGAERKDKRMDNTSDNRVERTADRFADHEHRETNADNNVADTNKTRDKREESDVHINKTEDTYIYENRITENKVEKNRLTLDSAEETEDVDDNEVTENEEETNDKVIVTDEPSPSFADDSAIMSSPNSADKRANITDNNSSKPRTQGATVTGHKMQFYDFRSSCGDEWDDDSRPHPSPGQLWTDPEFDLREAITDRNTNKKLTWKRPTDLSPNPVLFSDGTTRFDIGQGSAGTCYFLSTVANISESKELLKQVVPDDAYPVGTPDYEGIFHARFWCFGKWVDVFIDDYLPVIHGTSLWGAKSAIDENEFWVSLLEKAFARHHGSYNDVYGGQPGDAFMALTGGVAERIDFKDDDTKPEKLFERVRNAVQSGAFVTCTVPDEFDKVHGLVGGHAYSLTATTKVKGASLLRVRNPWGNTEWTGPWSDGGPEWKGVSQSEVPRAVKDDGEFWISLEDFVSYFSQTTICSLTPDFDMDGDSDSLDYVTNIYGEWNGETAAGFANKLKNPRFVFTVPDTFSEAQVVLQLIQHKKKRQDDGVQMRCDLYKVLGDSGQSSVLEIMGENTNSYNPESQSSFRHTVTPGTYAIVPSTVNAGQEKSFLVRLFSSCPVSSVREMPKSYKTMSTEQQTSVDYRGKVYQLTNWQAEYGAWSNKAGNAGGQVSHGASHANNPQYLFSVHTKAMVVLHVMQENSEPQGAVGFMLFEGGEVPMDIDQIYSKYESAIADTEGNKYMFVQGWDVSATYLLKPGEYTMLLHLNDPGEEKNYAMIAKSSAPVQITGYQTGA